jgi:type I restriction enzyme M protein
MGNLSIRPPNVFFSLGSAKALCSASLFVHQHRKNPSAELAICGQEKVGTTVALCNMNLAVHGLEGDSREANSYYDDEHNSTGNFDFVLANPPFNVNAVDKDRLKDAVGQGRRYPFGVCYL